MIAVSACFVVSPLFLKSSCHWCILDEALTFFVTHELTVDDDCLVLAYVSGLFSNIHKVATNPDKQTSNF